MSRIVKSINEVQAVASGDVEVPAEKSSPDGDLHRGVVGNGVGKLASRTSENESSAAPFPVECLSGVGREMALEVSRVERIPTAIAAACVIGILSAAIGKGLRISSHPGKICPGNLYVLCGLPSGSNKSETFRPIAAPLYKFEAEKIETWKQFTLPDLLQDQKYHASRIKAIERQFALNKAPDNTKELQKQLGQHIKSLDEASQKIHGPRLLCENATSEALGLLLSQNRECIASISPDAREVIDVLAGRYRNKGKTDEGIYLKGFSLEPYIVDRVNRPPLTIREACISCLWLVQPDKMDLILGSRSLAQGGLLPRFLICRASFLPKPLDRNSPGINAGLQTRWETHIQDLLQAYRLADKPHILTPTAEAVELLDRHHDSILQRRGGELASVNEFAARWNEQAWRLCVVLHAGEYGAAAHDHEVSEQTARNAILIADWFADGQLRLLGWSKHAAESDMWQRVLALAAQHPDGLVAAHVYHKRIVSTSEAAHTLLARMENQGLLKASRNPQTGGGWVDEKYFIPKDDSKIPT